MHIFQMLIFNPNNYIQPQYIYIVLHTKMENPPRSEPVDWSRCCFCLAKNSRMWSSVSISMTIVWEILTIVNLGFWNPGKIKLFNYSTRIFIWIID